MPVLLFHKPSRADAAVDREVVVRRDPVGDAVAVAVDCLSHRIELLVRGKPTDSVDDIPGFVARWSYVSRRADVIHHAVGAAYLKPHQFAGCELQAVAGLVQGRNHRRLARRIVQMVGGHHGSRHGRGRQQQAGLQRLQHKRTGARLTAVTLFEIEQFLELHDEISCW